jgi:radical SAM superfamily enzyme YgiQ (UPF0313 family)
MAMGMTLVYPAYKTENNHPPLGILYLATMLKERKTPVKILDTTFIENDDELEREIIKNKNKVYGLSVVTPYINKAVFIAQKIKKLVPDAIIVFGGPHATIRPEETLDEPVVDIVVLGEAEDTITELMKALEDGKDLIKVKGIGFKKGKKKIINERRAQIKNLDDIPIPDRTLLETFARYCEIVGGDFFTSPPATTMITSRGCPFNCNFCQPSLREIFGPTTRFRSAKNVVGEIEYLHNEFDLKKFHFVDDTFTAHRGRLFDFAKELEKRGLKIQWTTNSRVNTIDREVMSIMKKVGCKRLSFGVESGSQQILNKMNKFTTIDQIIEAFQLCTEFKIFSVGSFILGYPGETYHDMEKTKRLIKIIEPDRIDLHIANPIIGTQLYDFAKKEGLLLEDNYEKYTRHGHHYLLKLGTPKEDLLKFENSIYKMFRGMKRSYFFKTRKWYSAQTEVKLLWWHFRENPIRFIKHLPRLVGG